MKLFSLKNVVSGFLIVAVLASTALVPPAVYAEEITTPQASQEERELIVKYKTESVNLRTASGREKVRAAQKKRNFSVQEHLERANMSVIEIADDQSVAEAIAVLESDPTVEYVEPNYSRTISVIASDDTHRALLWGLDNTGQTISTGSGDVAGTLDADMDAPEAWAINEGVNADVIVAVIDNGVLYTHPDLSANMWDGTNCKDETGAVLGGCNHGYDYQSDDTTPLPVGGSSYHGTHVAGIVAATKNNGAGVAGIAPRAQIMALRFDLNVSTEIKAIDFAIQNGAKIINASYGGEGFSQAEYDAIQRFRDAGGLFIAAAGNDATSNDTTPVYPAAYDLDNIISVAATDQQDALASFSNYGAVSVDVGAPGENILSTVLGNNYGYLDGTSMASPYTAGLAALVWGYKNNLNADQVKNILLSTGDAKPALNAVTVSGKRVNAQKALAGAAVIDAQNIHDTAVEGLDPGNFPSEDRALYQTAIDTATTVLDNAESDESAIGTAVADLDTATATFLASVIPEPEPEPEPEPTPDEPEADPVDFTVLISTLAQVQALHDGAVEGAALGNYTVGSKAVLQAAITTATLALDAETQELVDDAVAALNAAKAVFESGRVNSVSSSGGGGGGGSSGGSGGGGGGGGSAPNPAPVVVPTVLNPVPSPLQTPIVPGSAEDLARELLATSKSTCPADQILTQNLKTGARNGKYHAYTKATVREAHILQGHLNRLGFNSGPNDGILGPKSDVAIKRLQKSLGTKQDGYVGPVTRGLLNTSCK